MMVASSDMSHYIAAARARELDFKAIERMLQLDAEGLYRVVRDNRISMCGVAPAVIMLSAARAGRRRAGASWSATRIPATCRGTWTKWSATPAWSSIERAGMERNGEQLRRRAPGPSSCPGPSTRSRGATSIPMPSRSCSASSAWASPPT